MAFQSEERVNMFSLQLGAPPVETILLEDILATVTSQTAIIKMDVQGYECKVHLQNL